MLGLSIRQTSLTSSSLISGIVLSSIAEKIRTCILEKRLCQKCHCMSMFPRLIQDLPKVRVVKVESGQNRIGPDPALFLEFYYKIGPGNIWSGV